MNKTQEPTPSSKDQQGIQPSPTELSRELQAIPAFADLPEGDLCWLASLMEVRAIGQGQVMAHQGDPATYLGVVLEGELQADRDDGTLVVIHAGQVTGRLPFSRMKEITVTLRATQRTRVATLDKKYFQEMLNRLPQLAPRLISIMADRIREITILEQQREKMAALGRLSAGLAHELNNPASAIRRDSENLRHALDAFRRADAEIEDLSTSAEARCRLSELEAKLFAGRREAAMADTLERSDRAEAIGEWLEKHGVTRDTWLLANSLAESGCGVSMMESVAPLLPTEGLGCAFTRLAASLALSRYAEEIESGSARISELVRAIKEYSYMDQTPEQEIDVHAGIENTLVILSYRLKHGVEVIRDYDGAAPRVCARGSELNQVWTNLIENAIDAMGGKGTLRIRTAREPNHMLVEIGDSGPGIPPEIRDHIFEPFFTTKSVGSGLGLGLDNVWRTVQKHRGNITVESKPGDTRFQVRLPAATPAQGGSPQ